MTIGTPSTRESCGRLAGSRASNLLKACGSRWSGTGETTPGGGPERAPTSGATTRKTTGAYRQTRSLDSVRILVTGAGGQLGRELIEVLAHDEVHGLDHRALDVSDRQAVFAAVERIRPSWIINAAAFNDVDGAERAPEQAFKVNASGPGYLADAAARTGAEMVH